MYDKFELLVKDAQIALCVMGNPQTSDFELVDVEQLPLSDAHRRSMTKRGMGFLGVVGLVNGAPQSAFEEPLPDASVDALAMAFMSHLAVSLKPLTLTNSLPA